jgi:hypothetical protein
MKTDAQLKSDVMEELMWEPSLEQSVHGMSAKRRQRTHGARLAWTRLKTPLLFRSESKNSGASRQSQDLPA